MANQTPPVGYEIAVALQEAIEHATKQIQADSCAVYLVDQEKDTLVLRATIGEYVYRPEYGFGEGLTGHIAITGKAVKIDKDTYTSHSKTDLPFLGPLPVLPAPSFVGVPLTSGDRVLGVIRAAIKPTSIAARSFSDADVQALSAIAIQLAAVIENQTRMTGKEVHQEQIYKTDLLRIELIAAINQEVITYLGRNPEALYELDAIRFEELIAALLEKDGWSVDLTLPTRDGGYDIVAVRNLDGIGIQLLAQAKRYRADRPVGVSAVRELYAVKHRHHASKALLATTSYVSAPAKMEFADVIPWELDFREYDDLTSWLKRHTK